MKKQFTYVLMGVAMMGVGAVANAQAPVAVPAAVPQVAPVSPAVAPTAAMDAKTVKKMKLQEAVSRMEQSLEARIANLDNLAVRIQTRIGKIQAEGKDMTAASAKLAEARKAITAARTELATLKKADVAMVASAKPATAFANIKNKTAKNVVAKIKVAHKALVDTITIMKGQGTPTSATSTVR